MAFCFSGFFIFYGYGDTSRDSCQAATIICVVFYLGQKVILYLFLVERIHIVRAFSRTRFQDCVYVLGFASVALGFAIISAALFKWRVSKYDTVRKVCQVGFIAPLTITILAWDILVNIFLTGVFLHHVRPYLSKGLTRTLVPRGMLYLMNSRQFRKIYRSRTKSVAVTQDVLVSVTRKSLHGCISICGGTVVNCIILLVFSGHEQLWMCFSFCTLDGMFVVDHLTASHFCS